MNLRKLVREMELTTEQMLVFWIINVKMIDKIQQQKKKQI